MSTMIMGIVTNGLVVPATPLPEGTQVEIHMKAEAPSNGDDAPAISPSEMRKLPREQRQAILAAAAELAAEDYANDKELTGFDAFSEECDEESY
jgi:hypothetical protein